MPPLAAATSRPLGNLELFFKTLADLGAPLEREHWAVHLALHLDFSTTTTTTTTTPFNPEPYLRRAWQVVRRRHPAIGSIIIGDDEAGAAATATATTTTQRPLLVVPDFDAAAWDASTFVVHHDHADANALFAALRPAPTATCHWLPAASQLVLRSSHWRLDGIGMAQLAHRYLGALADVLQQQQHQQQQLGLDAALLSDNGDALPEQQPLLPPSLEDMAREWIASQEKKHGFADDDNEQQQQQQQRREAGADALVAEFLRGAPSIGLPTSAGSECRPPGASSRVETQLDAAATAAAAAGLRAKGWSFTGAVHAAIARVAARFPQHPAASGLGAPLPRNKRCYAAFFPVDLRRAIVDAGIVASAHADEQLVFGLYFSGVPVCVDVGGEQATTAATTATSFADVARAMTAAYARDLVRFWTAPDDDSGRVLSLVELAEPYLERTTALFAAPVPAGLPPVQTPDLSGLGRVERYVQREYQSGPDGPRVGVASLWLGTEMINRCVQFHVWGWRDCLHIGACFNQSFYDSGFVARVLEDVRHEFLAGTTA